MRELLKRLHERRLKAWNEARGYLDAAHTESRDLSADEETAYQAAMTDVDALDARIAELLEAERRADAIDEALGGLPTPSSEPETPSLADQFRALARGEIRNLEIPAETRDLSKLTSGAGGAAVPTSFANRLVEHMIEVSGVLSAGPTIIETTSGESFEVPVTTSYSTADLEGETDAIAESDPAFAKRTLGAYKYAVLVQISRELLDDSAFDMESFIARQAGRAVGNDLGTDLVVGNASAKPSGIFQTSTLGVTGAASVAGAFDADDLIDLYYSVIAPYRMSPSCGWLMDDATIGAARKLREGSGTGAYLWQPSLSVGTPDTLLGKPVYADPNVAAVALSAKSVAFGDMAAYWVRLAGGIRFERSDEYAFNTDLVTFKCVVRGDGILADQTGAIKHFIGNAA